MSELAFPPTPFELDEARPSVEAWNAEARCRAGGNDSAGA
jgi:hypothetical protein